jgi:hypothetical protein
MTLPILFQISQVFISIVEVSLPGSIPQFLPV